MPHHATRLPLAVLLAAGLLTPLATTPAAHAHDRQLDRPAVIDPAPGTDAPGTDAATVQLAILLDTSNSMDGLIDQARSQLWRIVHELATARRAGLHPRLEVAVFEYGNNDLPASEGYVRQVTGFTRDLDAVSEALFSLDTNGGSEYCGYAVDEAVSSLDWSIDPKAYRVIFIAGNEPFTQGPVHYRQAMAAAAAGDVVVNTVHCGNDHDGRRGQWDAAARLGGGESFNIDQDNVRYRRIICPQDDEIARLNARISGTYRFFGEDARRIQANQQAQDANAARMGRAALADRAAVRNSELYDQSERDLVDNFRANGSLRQVPEAALPAEWQELTTEAREARVAELAEQRTALQTQLEQLLAERAAFLQEAQAQQDDAGEADLGDALVEALRGQAAQRGWRFDEAAE
jgi:hypothetical protein